MRRLGFSTGALAKGNFSAALSLLGNVSTSCVELSALRLDELPPLIKAAPTLDLEQFDYVAFHAPSNFNAEQERDVAAALRKIQDLGWPIIIHPDTLHDFEIWKPFENQLCLENLDKRKPSGRTWREMSDLFQQLPSAGFCCDLAHAHQVDGTMTEAVLMLDLFRDRLRQVHLSALDTNSRHRPIHQGVAKAFRKVSPLIPENTPVIIESILTEDNLPSIALVQAEISRAKAVLPIFAKAAAVVGS